MIEADDKDLYLKIDALISHILHIPFPEQLDDEVWALKWAQVRFLIDKGIIAPKAK